jgi:threonine/homoserine/homoserine lactone efflux protein
MSSYTYISALVAGLLVSLAGSLPLGNLNLSAMHISAQKGWKKAAGFSVGVVGVEVIYLALSFQIIVWIVSHHAFLQTLQWGAVLILFLLAVSSFRAAHSNAATNKNRMLDNDWPQWALGAAMSAVNPLQFTYWAGWILALSAQGILSLAPSTSALFVIGAGLGTLCALTVFIVVGNRFSGWMLVHHKFVNGSLAFMFFAMGVYQLVKILS